VTPDEDESVDGSDSPAIAAQGVALRWFGKLERVPMRWKLIGSFGPILSLVVALSWTAFQTTLAGQAPSAAVTHTLEVLRLADEAQAALVDMETGFRGFELTGRDEFLEPYVTGDQVSHARLATLQLLTEDNASQAERWRELTTQLDAWKGSVAEPGIALRRSVNRNAPAAGALNDENLTTEGKRRVDAMRTLFGTAIQTEDALLAQRDQFSQSANQKLQLILVSGTALSLVVGIITALLMAHDITTGLRLLTHTTRKLATQTEELRHKERFRGLLESAPDAMVIVDNRGCIELVNRQTEVLFGYSREELIGYPVEVLIPQRFREGHVGTRSGYQHAPHTRIMGAGLELFGMRKDNSEFPVEISLSPLETEGEILISSAIRDISARQLVARQLQEKNSELEAANTELEAFSYSVSHDLRAPLRAVNGFSTILLEEHASELSQEVQHYLHLLAYNGNYMGQLVDGLLTFARLNRQVLDKQRVLPEHLVSRALDALALEQNGRRVDISIGTLLPCEASPTMLMQVFLNLLSNALKFTRMRDVAHIRIGCRQADGEVIYFVQDDGVGFDMQYAHKVFGVFQRLHRTEDYEGTGAGLAIVQRIVQRHGGRIWADGVVDRGATFSFTLEDSQRAVSVEGPVGTGAVGNGQPNSASEPDPTDTAEIAA
jgi:PAS domain S-box-containing protein